MPFNRHQSLQTQKHPAITGSYNAEVFRQRLRNLMVPRWAETCSKNRLTIRDRQSSQCFACHGRKGRAPEVSGVAELLRGLRLKWQSLYGSMPASCFKIYHLGAIRCRE